MLFNKGNVSNPELQRIQNYIILSVLGGMHIPVRRSKDYVDFKIRNVDREKDNYIRFVYFVWFVFFFPIRLLSVLP